MAGQNGTYKWSFKAIQQLNFSAAYRLRMYLTTVYLLVHVSMYAYDCVYANDMMRSRFTICVIYGL